MWTFIFLVAAVFFAIGCLKWKVSTLALIYYMEKNRHKVPRACLKNILSCSF